MGPKVHLAGPCNILTNILQGGMEYSKCLTNSWNYMKDYSNTHRFSREISYLGWAVTGYVNFVKKSKKSTTHIFAENERNWNKSIVLGPPHWDQCCLAVQPVLESSWGDLRQDKWKQHLVGHLHLEGPTPVGKNLPCCMNFTNISFQKARILLLSIHRCTFRGGVE